MHKPNKVQTTLANMGRACFQSLLFLQSDIIYWICDGFNHFTYSFMKWEMWEMMASVSQHLLIENIKLVVILEEEVTNLSHLFIYCPIIWWWWCFMFGVLGECRVCLANAEDHLLCSFRGFRSWEGYEDFCGGFCSLWRERYATVFCGRSMNVGLLWARPLECSSMHIGGFFMGVFLVSSVSDLHGLTSCVPWRWDGFYFVFLFAIVFPFGRTSYPLSTLYILLYILLQNFLL